MRILLLLVGLVVSTTANAAAFITPLVGGSGGSSYTRSCGTSAVLVGVQVRYGAWLDQMTPICRRFNADGTLGTDFTLSRIGGTGGGTVEQGSCPTGKLLTGLSVRWGTYIHQVILFCASWNAATKTRGSATMVDSTLGSNYGGSSSTGLGCPSGQVAKAIKGKAGIYVDSLSMVCNAWNK
jgi:hypothetical protein